MKGKIIFLILCLSIALPAAAEVKTGFFLSLGQSNYTSKNDPNSSNTVSIDAPTDFFLGATLQFTNRFELNLIYNRAKEELITAGGRYACDRNGIGLEVGKIIAIHLFNKSSLSISADVVGGGYFLFYPTREIRSATTYGDYSTDAGTGKDFQAGFYWALRLQYRFAKKTSIDIGFKSLLPVSDKREFQGTTISKRLFKSFFTIGISL